MKDNPYVGPRPYERSDREVFFGRPREARELRALIHSEREVLFYAQSGAGKTSLLNARVIPEIEEDGFLVLPPARVGGALPVGIEPGEVENVYVYSVLLALAGEDSDPRALLGYTLRAFLEERLPAQQESGGQPVVLILDQFEEIFSRAERLDQVEPFFRQVREALDALPELGIVLSMREDHLAEIDPYVTLFARRLRARFRIERLGIRGALAAIKRPAEQAGIRYDEGVAERLVDDLRQIKVQRPGGGEEAVPGPYVEPVQLQVVCSRLWERLPKQEDKTIHSEAVRRYGDVDRALTEFYESALTSVCRIAPGDPTLAGVDTDDPSCLPVTERRLRDWFEQHLITPLGTRGLVLRGERETEGLPNEAVDILQDLHILRADVRAGARWVELAHDRLVAPIRESNAAWQAAHLSPLQTRARRWSERGRPGELLLRGAELADLEEWADRNAEQVTQAERDYLSACREALSRLERWALDWVKEERPSTLLARGAELEEEEAWASAHPAELTPVGRAYLQASQEARSTEEQERRQNRRIRRLAVGATILAVVALVAAGLALRSGSRATASRQTAVAEADAGATAAAEALFAGQTAVAAGQTEVVARQVAEAEANAGATAAAEAVSAGQAAVVARQTAEAEANSRSTAAAEALSARQTAEAEAQAGSTAAAQALSERDKASDLAAKLASLLTVQAPTATPGDERTPTPPGTPAPDRTPTATATPNLQATQVVQAAQTALAQSQGQATGEGTSPYIFGLYDSGGEFLMANSNRRGWIVLSHELGRDPTQTGGFDYRPWTEKGYGCIAQLNHGYGNTGTIPLPEYYGDFAQRVGNWVAGSKGCHVWVIGHHMNHGQHQPEGQAILPEGYAQVYTKVRAQIKRLDGRAADQVVIGAVAPWNSTTTYPANPRGDWIQYYGDLIRAIRALGSGIDGFALTTYTHGAEPDLVVNEAMMGAPFQDRHFEFRAYRDFMGAIPTDLRYLPVYIIETDQSGAWEDANRGWVQNAYREIDSWNRAGNQRIRALVLYRWEFGDRQIKDKPGVQEDFKAAMENPYVWE